MNLSNHGAGNNPPKWKAWTIVITAAIFFGWLMVTLYSKYHGQ